MRLRKLLYSSFSSILYQIILIVYGLVIPRMILGIYGSDVNGLINSIAQFLRFVAFLQLGIGAVVQSALYLPLANGDTAQVSRILTSSKKFFQRIGTVFIIYVVILCFVFPFSFLDTFEYFFTFTLIAAISLNQIAEYMYGINYQLLLFADQKAYINYFIQISTLIVNFVVCIILIKTGTSIQIVKLSTALIYLVRPLMMYCYIKCNYSIDFNAKYDKEPIAQKWNGVAQHISALVVDSTDVAVLTIFSTLKDVSIYSVYNLVVMGLRQLISSATSGMRALLGDMYARGEKDSLNASFSFYEWSIHTISVIVFSATGVLLVPFVKIYTANITDANYIQPLFSALLTLSVACYIIRDPYITMVNAAGHYKQTQTSAIMEAVINVFVSILLVIKYGLIGVAIGTVLAMIYRTVYFAIYVNRHLVPREHNLFIKQIAIDIFTALTGILVSQLLVFECANYIDWMVLSCETCAVIIFISVIINSIFYRNNLSKLLNYRKLLNRRS